MVQPEKEVNPKSLSVFVRARHPVAPEVAAIRASYIGRKLIDFTDDPAELEHLRSELPEVTIWYSSNKNHLSTLRPKRALQVDSSFKRKLLCLRTDQSLCNALLLHWHQILLYLTL